MHFKNYAIIFITLLIINTNAFPRPYMFSSKAYPFADKIITCREMRLSPKKIFSYGIDLGSGHWTSLDVEGRCRDSLATIPFLSRLYQLTETIRGQSYRRFCGSPIIIASRRYYEFHLLRASFAPELLLTKRFQFQIGVINKLEKYFQSWAYQSSSNLHLYQEFFAELKKVQPLLNFYYQKKFGFSHHKASLIATQALFRFKHRAAGSFPSSLVIKTHLSNKLGRLVISKNINMPVIRKMLKDMLSPRNIDKELKAALLNNQPRYLIKLLVNYADSINKGDESVLFFAIHNKKYIPLLLKRGAKINYANGFGKTALFYAIENNNYKIVKYLLRHGANPNHPYKSREELAKYWCKYNIKHTKRTPLMHAAQHSNIRVLKLLLKYKAKLSDIDGLKFNALDYAIKFKQSKNADFLRLKGLKAGSS